MFQALLRRRRAQLDETLGPAAASTGWCLCRRPQTRLFIPGKAKASRGWSCCLGIWRWPWDARLFLLSRQIQHRLVSALSPSPHHHSVTLALPPVIKRPTAKKKATQPVSQQAGSPTHWNPLIGIALLRGLMMRLHTTDHNHSAYCHFMHSTGAIDAAPAAAEFSSLCGCVCLPGVHVQFIDWRQFSR